jgi:hypothetical protein
MKHPFLIMLLASSTVFSIEEPLWFKQARQKLFGKYLITQARENNCPEVAALLKDLRTYTPKKFIDQSPFEKILQQDPEIQDIIYDISTYKRRWAPCDEASFAIQYRGLTLERKKRSQTPKKQRSFLQSARFWTSKIITTTMQILQNPEEKRRFIRDVEPYSLENLLIRTEAKIEVATSIIRREQAIDDLKNEYIKRLFESARKKSNKSKTIA